MSTITVPTKLRDDIISELENKGIEVLNTEVCYMNAELEVAEEDYDDAFVVVADFMGDY